MQEMTTVYASGRQEWAQNWHLPVIAMLGITGSAAYSFGSGLFMEPITKEFGWSRTEFASAMTLLMLLGVLTDPLAGRLLAGLDRGPPRMAWGLLMKLDWPWIRWP